MHYADEIKLATGEEAKKLRNEALGKLIKDFSEGNLTVAKLKLVCNAIGVNNLQIKTSDNQYFIQFRHEDSEYSIKCETDLAASDFDKLNRRTFSKEELEKEFTESEISTFFKAVSFENEVATRFVFSTEEYSTLEDLKSNLYNEYRQSLILDNYLNDNHKKGNNSVDLYTTSSGVILNTLNYKDYRAGIKILTGAEKSEARQKSLEKLLKDYPAGNLAHGQLNTLLKAIGATNINKYNEENTSVVEFTYQNTDYVLRCNDKAAEKGNDDVQALTYLLEDLQKEFTENEIAQYFEPALVENEKVCSYKLKGSAYESKEELQNAIYTQAKCNLIIRNFLEGITSISNKSEDLLTLPNGEILSEENFLESKNEMNNKKISDFERDKAFNKLKNDFLSGNLAFAQVELILFALGVKDLKISEDKDVYVLNFKYSNIEYCLNCSKVASEQGNDEIVVENYTKDELLEKLSSEDQISDYFDVIETQNGVEIKYALKLETGFKTLEELITSLESQSKKNIPAAVQELRDKLEELLPEEEEIAFDWNLTETVKKVKPEIVSLIMMKFDYSEDFAGFLADEILELSLNGNNTNSPWHNIITTKTDDWGYEEYYVKSTTELIDAIVNVAEKLEFLTDVDENALISQKSLIWSPSSRAWNNIIVSKGDPQNIISSIFNSLEQKYSSKFGYEVRTISSAISAKIFYKDNSIYCYQHLMKLDLNGNGTPFDDLYELIDEEFAKYIPTEELTPTNSIKVEELFGKKEELTFKDLDEYSIKALSLSEDYGCRKFAELLKNNCADEFGNVNVDVVSILLILINRALGVSYYQAFLTKESMEKLNAQSDVFKFIEDIINSQDFKEISTRINKDYYNSDGGLACDDTELGENYSQIWTPYYKGDLYYVENNNNVLTITNQNNGNVVEVDLNILLQNLPDSSMEYVLKLPAEVIIDMWYEAEFHWGSAEGTGGVYSGDWIDLNDFTSIIHETGHGVDDLRGFYTYSGEFVEAFNIGLERFLADGNTKYEGRWVGEAYRCVERGPYCTSNEREMFAECYEMCMTGVPDYTILTYFPECLELVIEQIKYVHSLPPAERSGLGRK